MPLTYVPFAGGTTPPADPLWRYLTLQKFVALLEHRALHFAGMHKFERDPLEGRVPPRMRAEAGKSTPSGHIVGNLDLLQGIGWTLDLADREIRAATAVCCWNVGAYEDDNLWRAYVQGRGVVIRSDWDRLVRSTAASERILLGGRVLYPQTDGMESWLPNPNVMAFAFRKRVQFSSDSEFRLMTTDWPRMDGPIVRDGCFDVGIDLGELIAEVRLAPHAAAWELELVERLCTRYGLPVHVGRSELDARQDR